MTRQAMYNPGLFFPRSEPKHARKESRKQEAEESDDVTQEGCCLPRKL